MAELKQLAAADLSMNSPTNSRQEVDSDRDTTRHPRRMVCAVMTRACARGYGDSCGSFPEGSKSRIKTRVRRFSLVASPLTLVRFPAFRALVGKGKTIVESFLCTGLLLSAFAAAASALRVLNTRGARARVERVLDERRGAPARRT